MSGFDPTHTAEYYDEYGDQEAQRWRRGPSARMQYEIYCHHLRAHVRSGDRVLDAGCGPGTFAKVLLDLGARVTCLDISSVQLEACRNYAPGADAYELGSITDLSRFPTHAFDVALALGGPISYCFDQAERAVSELQRVTRPGGKVGLSVMGLYGVLHRFLPAVLTIPIETNRRILATGDLPRDLSRDHNRGHECHMFGVEELKTLLDATGLLDVELSSSGWIIPDDEIEIPEVGTDDWRMLFEAELRACAESPGAGTHIIAWGCTPDERTPLHGRAAQLGVAADRPARPSAAWTSG